ncbi:ABC transporter ATP-binding protein [Magnetospirillum sp. 64-120]|uniref:ABC transporter ATP-binding protein n=1 Tax=Magnetospirillum sp. 64-120 TaxID=1895778 RepID=UPI000929DBBD|nr:ABC transporter ATP-binding protein [Magnetospirillum sp. 64-120]OJX75915.1 MAG: hypothetical protein BGO92_15230 [Magnetospirillum sp. 64-120]
MNDKNSKLIEEIQFMIRTIRSVRHVNFYFVLSIALSILITALEAIGLISIVPILQFLGSDPLHGSDSFLSPFFDLLKNDAGVIDIKKVALFVLFVAILKSTFVFISGIVGGYIPVMMKAGAVRSLLKMHLRSNLINLMQYDTGAWTSVYYRFIDQLCSIVMSVASSITQALLLALYGGIMFAMSPYAVMLTLLFVVVLWLTTRWMTDRQGRIGRQITDAATSYQQAGLQMISGMRLVQTVAGEDRMEEWVAGKLHTFVKFHYKAITASSIMQPITTVASGLFVASLLFFGDSLFSGKETDWLGSIILFVVVFYRMLGPATGLYGVRITIAQLWPALQKVKMFFELCSRSQLSFGDRDLGKSPSFDISISGLNFGFADTPILQDINLSIPSGSMLALVGESGAGKSTLANLIMRLYPTSAGQISIGGVNISEFSRKSFAENVGLVSQDTILFNDTLKNNFLFVQPDATEAEIWEALKKAKADQFVEELEQGLDTVIQEGGSRLSGGQRQRIALARALIRPKQILILDESTSQLDAFSEAVVQETITNLHGTTTLIVIAHRMSTVRKADAVAVLENGRVVEFGTPNQLLMEDTMFRQMIEFQQVSPA